MASATESSTSGPETRKYRLAKRLGIGIATVVGIFLLVVFVLPTPIARYVIESQLDELGIEHDGIETIDIDLWNSQVRAGPVSFRAGDAREGQLGEVAFDYSFGALIRGRGFVSTFILSGVDVFAARLADGSITLNGVNLTALGASEEEAAAEPEPPPEGESVFGVGVDRFEFRDSKLFFEDLTGGSLAVDLELLTIEGLRTWSPDEPTRVTLQGRLNEMQLSIAGSVLPLADPIRVSIGTRIEGITLDRVARFVGPIGLERRNGKLDTRVQYDYAIHRDGRIEGTVDGTYHLSGLDVSTPEGQTLTLTEALLEVDMEQMLNADGSASAAGELRLDGSSLSLASGLGDVIEVGALALTVEDLHLTKGSEQRRPLLGWTSAAAESGSDAAGARSIVALVIGQVEALARDLLSHVFKVDGRNTVTLTDGRVRLAARGDMPVRDVGFEKLEVVLDDLESDAFDGGVKGSVHLGTAITGLRASGDDGSLEANLSNLRMDSQALEVSVTTERTTIAFDLSTVLEALTASDARVGSVALRELSLGTGGISLEQTAGDTRVTGPVVLRLEGLESTLSDDTAGDMTARGETLELNLSSVTLEGHETLEAGIAGSLEASGLAAERGGESALAFALSSIRTQLDDIRIAPLDASAAIEGRVATSVSKFSFGVGSGENALSGSLESLDNRVEQLEVSGLEGTGPNVSLVSHIQLDGFEASLPTAGGQTTKAAVASVAVPITELALQGKAVRAAGALEVRGITANTEGETPQTLDLPTLSVAGITGDSEAGVAIERIELGKLSAALTLPPRGAPEKGGKSADEEPAEAKASAEDGSESTASHQRVKIGELAVSPGSKIVVSDKNVEPPVHTTIALEQLKVGPIDTGAPDTRTNLAVSTLVNEASALSIEGWASPLAQEPSLALTTRIKSLSLPHFSPYAASATGVNIESGTLWTTANAKADKGRLDGKIDIRIGNLFVAPVSEEEAKALEANTGLPVGFAVAILKDEKGVIELGFPVSGTVAEPKLDYSEAINKALAGAMTALFPTNWFGGDGNAFDMKPATFTPGTTELTAEGRAVADQIADVFSRKPNVRLHACGRAARADVIALRGGGSEPSSSSGSPSPVEEPAHTEKESSEQTAPPEPPTKAVVPPSEKEADTLLALATKRGAAIREYLSVNHGIDPARVPECRTAYNVEDGKPPRAEFIF